jgi:phosphatidylserine/phosphatidylglycerophosphate/cardiolipin synthase-like enzyme
MILYKTKSRRRQKLLRFNFNNTPRLLLFLGGVGIGFFIYQSLFPSPQAWVASDLAHAPVQVCFSPEGECADGIVRAIQEAKTSIYLQAYSFTSTPLAQALVEAKERGLDVQILIDKSRLKEKYSQVHFLAQNGIPIFIDSVKGLAHNKTIIFDGHSLLTGSFNFTNAANTRNAENVLMIQSSELARIYKSNWEKRMLQAKPLE